MRAVVHDRYGPPEVLRVSDVELPLPKEDEVLVRVHASTVTRGDAMGVRSAEYRFTRIFTAFVARGGRASARSSRDASKRSARP
jgi:NADPH:quinone reductase-like Zn-dependent oxidoreductase